MESAANYPRIIIDRKIIPELFSSTDELIEIVNNFFFKRYGEKDGKLKIENISLGGKIYINYMRMLVRYGPTYKIKNIESILNLFKDNYYSNDHYVKYNWLLEELKFELDIGKEHYKNHPEIASSKRRIRQIALLQSKLDML